MLLDLFPLCNTDGNDHDCYHLAACRRNLNRTRMNADTSALLSTSLQDTSAYSAQVFADNHKKNGNISINRGKRSSHPQMRTGGHLRMPTPPRNIEKIRNKEQLDNRIQCNRSDPKGFLALHDEALRSKTFRVSVAP